jgi:hypothetical protein
VADLFSEVKAALTEGRAGITMGRNILESDDPEAMIAALSAMVHDEARRLRRCMHFFVFDAFALGADPARLPTWSVCGKMKFDALEPGGGVPVAARILSLPSRSGRYLWMDFTG